MYSFTSASEPKELRRTDTLQPSSLLKARASYISAGSRITCLSILRAYQHALIFLLWVLRKLVPETSRDENASLPTSTSLDTSIQRKDTLAISYKVGKQHQETTNILSCSDFMF